MTEPTLSLKERMASAITGSLITSFILTPMDVVRIRLQQQELLPDCSCEVGNNNINKGVANGVNSKPSNIGKLVPHTLRSGMHSSVVFWQTSCFKDMNCKNSSIRYNSTFDAFQKIARIEGLPTLWRGLSLTLFMAIPANIVYFTGYEYIRDSSPFGHRHPLLNPVICGALARVIAASSIAPFELFKTRLQSIPTSNKTKTSRLLRDIIKETKVEIKSEGLKAVFKGLEITLWRDVPFSAIYWGSYEYCKLNLSILNSFNKPTKLSDTSLQFIESFIHGSISGTIAALFTHPFDVGKTRLQISLKENNTKGISKNMFVYLNNIRKAEGIKTLFTGLTPRVAKIAPSCAIMISTYEISKRIFLD